MDVDPQRYPDDPRYPTPGVYFEQAPPPSEVMFGTGQPAFLGLAHPRASQHFEPIWLTRWEQFAEKVGLPGEECLADAVRGFFENDGERCAVVSFPAATIERGGAAWNDSVRRCLERLERMDGIDLICAPDLPQDFGRRVELQQLILDHCRTMGGRFAILEPPRDPPPEVPPAELALQNWHKLTAAKDGALYYPWLRIGSAGETRPVPPCGHVAGIYARADRRVGVHKAPANEIVNGVVDLLDHVGDREHRLLNDVGVNCVRAFPGRGIRVWGARTLSGRAEWRYVNVRRLFLSLKRWISETSRDLVFEPNVPELQDQVRDRLNGYCYGLFQSGALKGLTPQESYFVKCDDETNLRAGAESGMIIAEIGLAPVKPAEFVVVRVTQSAAGTTME